VVQTWCLTPYSRTCSSDGCSCESTFLQNKAESCETTTGLVVQYLHKSLKKLAAGEKDLTALDQQFASGSR
jgi:hypothetical protein